MSGPTNRRFVRSAWALLAFQFVAAGGALALTVWAATRVQTLIDQRDLLQARVTQLESRPAPADGAPATGNVTMPAEAPASMPVVRESATKALSPPARVPPARNGGSGVTVHTAPPPTIVIDTPTPPPQPPDIHVPPRQPPVSYPPPRRPPVIVRPSFPTRPYPTREPPIPGTLIRPARPGSSAPPQQPVPGATIHPNRPSRIAPVRPIRPAVTQPQAGAPVATRPSTIARPINPRRIRRPRATDTEPQPNPPK